MSNYLQPPIILLREGTDTSQGKAQLLSNINACNAVGDVVRSTLGPRGMDKLIHDSQGSVTISNDGATIMKKLEVVHPAATMLVDIAKAQDAEVGDGTTSCVVIASQLLKESKQFVEDGVHPQAIIRAFRSACRIAVKRISDTSRGVIEEAGSDAAVDDMLKKCAMTTLNSKLISHHKEFFADIIVSAVRSLDFKLGIDLNLVGIKKVPGGSVRDSFLVDGVAFKKTFAYAGFEQQPKSFVAPKIISLNMELELKSEKDNAEVRIEDPTQYQSIVDAEWKIIYDKLDLIVKSGAKIVLSKLAIGDLATQYFADRDIFCAGRVGEDDLQRVLKATGAQVQTTVSDIVPEVLGECGLFEEKQIGAERFNLFTGCPHARTATILLRGGAEQFIEETERSVHDALCIVRRTVQSSKVVAGGGAIEMDLSKNLRDHSHSIFGREQLLVAAFARALEVIPKTISDNAGFDTTHILNQLRFRHAKEGGSRIGVDIEKGSVCDTFESFVWEPSIVKMNALNAATEAACVILSIDQTVKNEESAKPGAPGSI